MSNLHERKYTKRLSATNFNARSNDNNSVTTYYNLWQLLKAASESPEPESFLRDYDLILMPKEEIKELETRLNCTPGVPASYVENQIRSMLGYEIFEKFPLKIEWGSSNPHSLYREVRCKIFAWLKSPPPR